MYAIRSYGDVPLRTNDALREYARLEYGSADIRWLLAAAAPRRKPAAAGPRLRLFRRLARPSHRAVACKGSPRRPTEEPVPA